MIFRKIVNKMTHYVAKVKKKPLTFEVKTHLLFFLREVLFCYFPFIMKPVCVCVCVCVCGVLCLIALLVCLVDEKELNGCVLKLQGSYISQVTLPPINTQYIHQKGKHYFSVNLIVIRFTTMIH